MLQIVKDTNVEDKNRDLFIKSIIRECKEQDVKYKLVTQEDYLDVDKPTIITDPYTYSKPMIYNNVDLDTTSNVIFDIIKELPSSEILLIGRGLIAHPLISMIIDKTNHTLTVANSHTTTTHLQNLIDDADIIINTSTSVIHTNLPMNNKLVIDINNNFQCNIDMISKGNYYNMRSIGKATVSKIVSNSKNNL